MVKHIDLTNQKFGRLTVIERVDDYISVNGRKDPQWLCQCDCGNFCIVKGRLLRGGITKSCGCLRKECSKAHHKSTKVLNLVGKEFGKLTVIKKVENIKKHTAWLCKCTCGNFKIVLTSNLTRGITKSCGCLNKSTITKHGHHGERLYRIWDKMKQRCFNKNSEVYEYYGSRGITVCDEWRDSFQVFYDWAMESGYEEGLSIDRIDNDGNYEPSNCRWATQKQQNNNKRNNVILTYKTDSFTVQEWSEKLNIPYSTLLSRLKLGWTVEKALETVAGGHNG